MNFANSLDCFILWSVLINIVFSTGPATEEVTRHGFLGQAKAAYVGVKLKVKKSIQKKDSIGASFLKNKTGKEAVLCMDGGGIKGLVLTELLFALEEVTGQPISELFDWVSGTSTGSFLALALATGSSATSFHIFVLHIQRKDPACKL